MRPCRIVTPKNPPPLGVGSLQLPSVLFITQPVFPHTAPLPAEEPYSNALLKSFAFINLRALLYPRSHRMSLKITQFRTLSPRWSTLARMKKGIGPRAGMPSALRAQQIGRTLASRESARSNSWAECRDTKKFRHRAEGEIFLLTFPFIGLLWVAR